MRGERGQTLQPLIRREAWEYSPRAIDNLNVFLITGLSKTGVAFGRPSLS